MSLAIAVGLATAVANLAPYTGSSFWGFLSLLALFSPLPLLWLGLRDGAVATLIAGCVAGAILVLVKLFLGLPITVFVYCIQLISVLVICRWALLSRATDEGEQWYPSGQIMIYLTALASGIVILTYVSLPESGLPLEKEALQNLAMELTTSTSAGLQMYEALVKMMYFYPAINGIASLLLIVANAGLAQKILEVMKENTRPEGAFLDVHLPGYYIWVFAGVGTVAVSGFMGQAALNMSVLMLTPFLLVGLAFVHNFVRKNNLGVITLGLFYLIMVAFGWTIALVALIGILEPWLGSHLKRIEIRKNKG